MKNKNYKNLYNDVRKISNSHDLMGLIRIGFPDDEYDPETSKVVPLLVGSVTLSELINGIVEIYNEMFDADFKSSDKWIVDFATELFEMKK